MKYCMRVSCILGTVHEKSYCFWDIRFVSYGHLQILRRAKEIGDFLIVGISSDSLIFSKKGRYPIRHKWSVKA